MIIYDISTIKPCIKPNLTTVSMAPKNGALALGPDATAQENQVQLHKTPGQLRSCSDPGRCQVKRVQRLNNNNMKIGMLWDIVWM